MKQKEKCPCNGCTRVINPRDCENKHCRVWQNWFLRKWRMIHGYYEKYKKQEETQ